MLSLALAPSLSHSSLVWRWRRREERKKCPLSSLSRFRSLHSPLPYTAATATARQLSWTVTTAPLPRHHRFLMPNAQTASNERENGPGVKRDAIRFLGNPLNIPIKEFHKRLRGFRQLGGICGTSSTMKVPSRNWALEHTRSQGAAIASTTSLAFQSPNLESSLVVGSDQIRVRWGTQN